MTARLPVGVGVDGFLAQQLRHILVRALLVAAEIEELIAVTHDGFPLLFKQGFELGKVLNDNAHGNLS